ncbi:hypothetical protein [Primorskyibacter flagellatus]
MTRAKMAARRDGLLTFALARRAGFLTMLRNPPCHIRQRPRGEALECAR